MKTSRLFKLTGIILLGLALTFPVNAAQSRNRHSEKSALTLTVDKPIIEFMAKAYADQIDASDIVRMQKMAGQIDHLTISFRDQDASDYLIKFKPLDEQGLEAWMFNEGYLTSGSPTLSRGLADMTTTVELAGPQNHKAAKKSVNLTINKPIIEYLAKFYADQIHPDDIFRIQKMCCQIDHVTVNFRDQDAVDYVLRFKSLNEKELQNWMFYEGYLVSSPESESAPIEPWMLNSDYLQ